MTNSKVTREQFEMRKSCMRSAIKCGFATCSVDGCQSCDQIFQLWQEGNAQGFAAGLEAAAKVCDQRGSIYANREARLSAGNCAGAIRALKGNQHE